MRNQKLVLFDFDGVIVDGMNEYWNSSLLACEKFLNSNDISIERNLYEEVSDTFKEIRPWVKYGWEMVIIVYEIIKKTNPLNQKNKNDFLFNYHQNCQSILLKNSWVAEDLQKFLNNSRKYQINKDFEKWVQLHKPFYEVLNLIKNAKNKQIKTAIITTKGKIFATRILEKLNIIPELIFGYESGTKVEIASQLSKEHEIIGFLEDRKDTLLEIKKSKITNKIPCFLADWGYLKDTDRINLPNDITLLKLKNIDNLLAI